MKKRGVKIEKRFAINLSLDDLLKLDGNVEEAAQKVIDEAKKESSYGFDLPVMNEILKQAEKQGKLTWSHKQINSCDYCDKKRDYYVYPRSSRNHRKGDKNYDKPIYYRGIKFNEGFIVFKGMGDMCWDCCTKHKVKERLIDYIINNDLKVQVMKNDYKPGKYLKDDIRICFDCGEEILESQMSKERTLMGDGYYPSGCPKCGAKSIPFGPSHKTSNKFGFIKNPEAFEEVLKVKHIIEDYNKDKDRSNQISFFQYSSSNYSFGLDRYDLPSWNARVLDFNTNSKKYKISDKNHPIISVIVNVLSNYDYLDNEENQIHKR